MNNLDLSHRLKNNFYHSWRKYSRTFVFGWVLLGLLVLTALVGIPFYSDGTSSIPLFVILGLLGFAILVHSIVFLIRYISLIISYGRLNNELKGRTALSQEEQQIRDYYPLIIIFICPLWGFFGLGIVNLIANIILYLKYRQIKDQIK